MVIKRMRKTTIIKIFFFIMSIFLVAGFLKDNVNPVSSFVTSDAINI